MGQTYVINEKLNTFSYFLNLCENSQTDTFLK